MGVHNTPPKKQFCTLTRSSNAQALTKHTVITGSQAEDRLGLSTNITCTDDPRASANTSIIRAFFFQDFISLLHTKAATQGCESHPRPSLCTWKQQQNQRPSPWFILPPKNMTDFDSKAKLAVTLIAWATQEQRGHVKPTPGNHYSGGYEKIIKIKQVTKRSHQVWPWIIRFLVHRKATTNKLPWKPKFRCFSCRQNWKGTLCFSSL